MFRYYVLQRELQTLRNCGARKSRLAPACLSQARRTLDYRFQVEFITCKKYRLHVPGSASHEGRCVAIFICKTFDAEPPNPDCCACLPIHDTLTSMKLKKRFHINTIYNTILKNKNHADSNLTKLARPYKHQKQNQTKYVHVAYENVPLWPRMITRKTKTERKLQARLRTPRTTESKRS